MRQKSEGRHLFLMGMVMILLALSADSLGLGTSPVFGYKQIILLVLGLLVTFIAIAKGRCSCKCHDE